MSTLGLSQRYRRLRRTPAIRRLVRETRLHPSQLIQPFFVVEGNGVVEAIGAMPGINRYSIDRLIEEVKNVYQKGLGGIILFGLPSHKDAKASGAYAKDGIIQRTVREVKLACPDMLVITDVCLCEYTDHGHCGKVDAQGHVLNDASVEWLVKTAISHAEAGADMVAPSDMMDGRVAAIRDGLDDHGFDHIPIMSYAAKYASAYYGPFREAAQSAPAFGDRRSYQMDAANRREALKEVLTDVEEGADIVMVKPALPCLDIISETKEATLVPVAAYQVSGEYAMIAAAAEKGWINEEAVMAESLTAIHRAGADIIITYYAGRMADYIHSHDK